MTKQNLAYLIPLFLFINFTFGSCQKVDQEPKKLWNASENTPSNTTKTILVTGLQSEDRESLISQAETFGIDVKGHHLLSLSGPVNVLSKLEISNESYLSEEYAVGEDEKLHVEKLDTSHNADEKVYYLAKKDFGLPSYWLKNPTHDGRGVKVGVIDDGISPLHEGFQETSTGERKFLARSSNSSFYVVKLKPTTTLEGTAASYDGQFDRAFSGIFNEAPLSKLSEPLDLNSDGKASELMVTVYSSENANTICVDSSANGTYENRECFGEFKASGEFGFWNEEERTTILADFDPESLTVRLSEGERKGDSHGEGVASVLAGHKLGGKFDGVAPGAQILDYDLSENSIVADERIYTLGTFFRALDWLGANGAEVINISYSLFFYSADSQKFAKKALDSLIDKYNFIISFSAGNNGPGLGSFNRGLLYPERSLVAGAFVSKDLNEYVHGVTGLPDPGRVVSYSSRGPAPDGGSTPTVISPLASISYATANEGYRAFSGTSSASPALAGMATVMLSAIKELELGIDVGSIVAAIRLSAVPLENVPFVDQGAGLPKISTALEIYKRLIEGKQFERIDVELRKVGPDGITRKGAFLRYSEMSKLTEFRANLRGIISNLAPDSRKTNLLKTVTIEYDKPWLRGPSRSFVSAGTSSIYVTVDRELLEEEASFLADGEHLASIIIRDSNTNEWLYSIPVSVVIDTPLAKESLKKYVALGPEEGKRVHFSNPQNAIGVRIEQKRMNGPLDAQTWFRFYDSSATITWSQANTESEATYYLPLEKSRGWHQLAVSRIKGGDSALAHEINLVPLYMEIEEPFVPLENSIITLRNDGLKEFVRLRIVNSASTTEKKLKSLRIDESFIHTTETLAPGKYKITLNPGNPVDVSNWITSCFLELHDSNQTLIRYISTFRDPEVTISETEAGSKLKISCRPFEFTTLENKEKFLWKLEVKKYPDNESVFAETITAFKPGINRVNIEWDETPEEGQTFEVHIEPAFASLGSRTIQVGTVEMVGN